MTPMTPFNTAWERFTQGDETGFETPRTYSQLDLSVLPWPDFMDELEAERMRFREPRLTSFASGGRATAVRDVLMTARSADPLTPNPYRIEHDDHGREVIVLDHDDDHVDDMLKLYKPLADDDHINDMLKLFTTIADDESYMDVSLFSRPCPLLSMPLTSLRVAATAPATSTNTPANTTAHAHANDVPPTLLATTTTTIHTTTTATPSTAPAAAASPATKPRPAKKQKRREPDGRPIYMSRTAARRELDSTTLHDTAPTQTWRGRQKSDAHVRPGALTTRPVATKEYLKSVEEARALKSVEEARALKSVEEARALKSVKEASAL